MVRVLPPLSGGFPNQCVNLEKIGFTIPGCYGRVHRGSGETVLEGGHDLRAISRRGPWRGPSKINPCGGLLRQSALFANRGPTIQGLGRPSPAFSAMALTCLRASRSSATCLASFAYNTRLAS